MSEAIFMQMEILLGSVGVTLSIFFGLLLLSKKDKAISNLFLAIYLLAFGLRSGKSLFHNYFELSPTLRTYFLSILFCVGPSIWLFSKYLISQKNENVIQEWKHYALFFMMLPACWFIRNNGSSIEFALFYNATIFHMFSYMIYAWYWFNRQDENLPFFKKNQNAVWLNSFLIVNIIMVILYFLISKLIIPYYLGIPYSYTLVIIIFGAWSLKNPELFKTPRVKYKSSNVTNDRAQLLFQKLKTLIEEEKPYLDASLNLSKLSQKIGASPKEVSQAINQVEQLNYSQFISRFRIEEAKVLLKSPSHSHFKIAAIAYECGFNSISSFNSLFKKHTSITAQEYRNSDS